MVGPFNLNPRIPREVVEGPDYEGLVKATGLSQAELDRRLEGLLFAIARIPERFPKVPAAPISVARHDATPPLLLFFTFTDTTVTLLGIQLSENEA